MVDLPIFGYIIMFLVNAFRHVMGHWNGTEEYYTQIKFIYSVVCDLLSFYKTHLVFIYFNYSYMKRPMLSCYLEKKLQTDYF